MVTFSDPITFGHSFHSFHSLHSPSCVAKILLLSSYSIHFFLLHVP